MKTNETINDKTSSEAEETLKRIMPKIAPILKLNALKHQQKLRNKLARDNSGSDSNSVD